MDVAILKASPYTGFVKDPAAHVYYAIKLTAKAKIMSTPFLLALRLQPLT